MSNLAWAKEAEPRAIALLRAKGFSGIEVAPTRIADWDALGDADLQAFRRRCDADGIVVSSLQAIYFNQPKAQLLGSAEDFKVMCDHTRRVGEIAAALGATVAVFGAPRNRLKGDLSAADAEALGAERFGLLGDIAGGHGLTLGIEPVPEYYGADFLTRVRDVAAMVERCAHPNIRVHLDCACIMLGGDDPVQAIRDYARLTVHYHCAEPDLGPFSHPRCDHAGAGAALRAVSYPGWVVIEMRQQGNDGLDALDEALSVVAGVYRGS
ncbi:sugar phosphate isomerase/epimerase family protein [Xanthobacter sp. VTT E-85241]|uniref:sugar phosphate isomerase/epimerase family protein n=1 Tax=Roseixanthobacter finlandensis TaxID=3119922 RepID=UPI002C9C6E88|nr:sugar phosphate isomerase/epimerase family protein [Xanthobacteraceae bacterium]